MNSTTTILIAMALALLLLAAFYGVSSSVVSSGSDAIDNFSDRADSSEDNISFASSNPEPDQKFINRSYKVKEA